MEDNKTPILVIGTGAEARMVLDIANRIDIMVYGFLSEDPDLLSKELNDVLIIAEVGSQDSDTLLADENIKVVIAEKEIEKRREFVKEVDARSASVISIMHPSVDISEYAKVGRGNILGYSSQVQSNALVGSFNLLEDHVTIGIDSIIGDYCTFQSGVRIGKEAVIEDGVFMGMGTIIHSGVTIGADSIIAAGSVVLQDVPEKSTVFGNPAKVID